MANSSVTSVESFCHTSSWSECVRAVALEEAGEKCPFLHSVRQPGSVLLTGACI